MEKYGVLVEHVCKCGKRVISRTNNTGDVMVKEAECEEGHVHVMEEVIEDGTSDNRSK